MVVSVIAEKSMSRHLHQRYWIRRIRFSGLDVETTISIPPLSAHPSHAYTDLHSCHILDISYLLLPMIPHVEKDDLLSTYSSVCSSGLSFVTINHLRFTRSTYDYILERSVYKNRGRKRNLGESVKGVSFLEENRRRTVYLPTFASFLIVIWNVDDELVNGDASERIIINSLNLSSTHHRFQRIPIITTLMTGQRER